MFVPAWPWAAGGTFLHGIRLPCVAGKCHGPVLLGGILFSGNVEPVGHQSSPWRSDAECAAPQSVTTKPEKLSVSLR